MPATARSKRDGGGGLWWRKERRAGGSGDVPPPQLLGQGLSPDRHRPSRGRLSGGTFPRDPGTPSEGGNSPASELQQAAVAPICLGPQCAGGRGAPIRFRDQ